MISQDVPDQLANQKYLQASPCSAESNAEGGVTKQQANRIQINHNQAQYDFFHGYLLKHFLLLYFT